jgi:hypothetical protein
VNYSILFSAACCRFPNFKLVYVENEVAWIPFYAHEWDKYYLRFRNKVPLPFMAKLPGEYVAEQVYATFFSDPTGGWMMDRYGEDTFMWFNDYPHAASTWPHSRQVSPMNWGTCPLRVSRKVVRENVIRLYDLKIDGINA